MFSLRANYNYDRFLDPGLASLAGISSFSLETLLGLLYLAGMYPSVSVSYFCIWYIPLPFSENWFVWLKSPGLALDGKHFLTVFTV